MCALRHPDAPKGAQRGLPTLPRRVATAMGRRSYRPRQRLLKLHPPANNWGFFVSTNNNKSNNNSNSPDKKKEVDKIFEKNAYNSADMAILDKQERRRPKVDTKDDPRAFAREIMGLSSDQGFGDTMNKRGLTTKRNVDVLDPIERRGVVKHPN